MGGGHGVLVLEDAVHLDDRNDDFRLAESSVRITVHSAAGFRFSPAAVTTSTSQHIVSLAGFQLLFRNLCGLGTSCPENQIFTKTRIGLILIVNVSAMRFIFPSKTLTCACQDWNIGPDGSEIRESRVFGLETEFERTWLNPWMLDDDELGLIGVSSAETIEFRTVYEEYGIRISAFRFAIYQIA